MPNTQYNGSNSFVLSALRLNNENLVKEIERLDESNKKLIQQVKQATVDIQALLTRLSPHLSAPEFYATLKELQIAQAPTSRTETDGPDADPNTGIPYGDLT